MKQARPPAAAEDLLVLDAPLDGWAAPLDEVSDPVFAERMLGDGLAVDPLGEALHAPCDGTIVSLPATRHAVTLRAANGAEILIHLGLETVALGGEGFRALAVEGQLVRRGDPLLAFDLDAVGRRAKSLITPIVVTNGADFEIVSRVTGRLVRRGEPVMELRALTGRAAELAASGPTLEAELTVALPHGLHARPAARLAAALKGLAAEVEVRLGSRRADARSAVALMAVGATAGAKLAVRAGGADAAIALEALRAQLVELAAEEVAQVAAVAPASAALEAAPHGALRGVPAAPGLAIGVIARLHLPEPVVRTSFRGAAAETRALEEALTAAEAALRAEAAAGGAHRAAILAAHEAFLTDPTLRTEAERRIGEGATAGVAWRDTLSAQAEAIRALGDERLAQRAEDLVDLQRRVLMALADEPAPPPALPVGAIVIADELLPSQLIALEAAEVAGVCTARGGATSHVAILAAAIGVPALCAMGADLLAISEGATAILDANAGLLHIAPDPAALAETQATLARREGRRGREQAAAQAPGQLADGLRIEVFANLGAPHEAEGAVARGAEGCGLFRTEFLYLHRTDAPSEAEQRASYQAAAEGLAGRPLTIRTLDAGGDKPLAFAPTPSEPNPALGLRGLRASLRRPDLLRTQLSAVLRVDAPGERRILLPMVTDVADLAAVRDLLEELAGGAPRPALGAMIETPASALLADQLAAHADFLSIGTNDLTQYVLAMDREHPELALRLDALHPAVLRLVGQAAAAATARGRPAGVCGGLASDPLAAPLLVGLGVRSLSAAPAAIPAVKARLAAVTLADCEAAAQGALALSSAAEVRALLAERFALPEDAA